MEALLAILAALVEPLAIVGAIVVVETALVLLQSAVVFGRDRHRARRGGAPLSKSPVWRRVRLAIWIALGASLLAIACLDRFWFEATVRWLLERGERKSGVAVEYRGVTGSLWTGELRFTGLRVRRAGDVPTRYEIGVENALVDVSVIAALTGRRHFDRIELHSMRGDYERVKKPDPAALASPFRVNELVADGIDVVVRDQVRTDLPFRARLQLDELRIRPLRSEQIWFDALFRGRAKGSIDGAAFEILTWERVEGRETNWRITGLPALTARAYLGPLGRLVRGGSLDLTVRGPWTVGEWIRVDTRWRCAFKDLEIGRERNDTPTALERKLGDFLSARAKDLTLEFALPVSEELFVGQVAFDALPIFAGLASAIADKLGVGMQLDPNELRAFGEGAKEAWKRAFELWKRK